LSCYPSESSYSQNCAFSGRFAPLGNSTFSSSNTKNRLRLPNLQTPLHKKSATCRGPIFGGEGKYKHLLGWRHNRESAYDLQWAENHQRKHASTPLASQLLPYFIRIGLVDAERFAVRLKFDFCFFAYPAHAREAQPI
jgi:hypothetical protein